MVRCKPSGTVTKPLNDSTHRKSKTFEFWYFTIMEDISLFFGTSLASLLLRLDSGGSHVQGAGRHKVVNLKIWKIRS